MLRKRQVNDTKREEGTDHLGTSLRDRAYAHIRRQLAEGELVAGKRLSVGSLANELGFSRTPIAEALLRLQLEGVVEQVHRVGTIVRTPDIKEIVELYELRELLEGHAASKAAEHFAPTDMERLDHLLEQMREMAAALRNSGRPSLSREEVRRYTQLDLAFHMVILHSVGNRRIRKVMEHARAFLLIFGSTRHEAHTLKTIADVYLSHARIRNAIRRKDPDRARAAMVRHIRLSREGAIDYLARHDPEAAELDLTLSMLIPAKDDALADDAPPGVSRTPSVKRNGARSKVSEPSGVTVSST